MNEVPSHWDDKEVKYDSQTTTARAYFKSEDRYEQALERAKKLHECKMEKEKERDFRKLYEEITNSEWFKKVYHNKSLGECPVYIPELEESEDERIRKGIIRFLNSEQAEGIFTYEARQSWLAWLEKMSEENIKKIRSEEYTKGYTDAIKANKKWQKEQKPIKMEVYEIGKGTTICGQDYKCKKDYKEGNCWYIKDVIYHCGRDGYLTDQNGVSWSCTPEWFNEYIQSNTEWAEEEKTRFVGGQFLQCKLSFDSFKEGEHYWLEYIGDDMYVGRSDNILNQKFHIAPRQLYTLFSQQLEEKQKEPETASASTIMIPSCWEEKQKEQNTYNALTTWHRDVVYTAMCNKNLDEGLRCNLEKVYKDIKEIVNSVPEKQKEIPLMNGDADLYFDNWNQQQANPTKRECFEEGMRYAQSLQKGQQPKVKAKSPLGPHELYNAKIEGICEGRQDVIEHPEQFGLCKPTEWSEEDKKTLDDAYCWIAEYAGYLMDKNYGKASMLMGLTDKLKSLRPQPKVEWSEEDETRLTNILIMIKEVAAHHYSKEDIHKSVDWLEKRFKSL